MLVAHADFAGFAQRFLFLTCCIIFVCKNHCTIIAEKRIGYLIFRKKHDENYLIKSLLVLIKCVFC